MERTLNRRQFLRYLAAGGSGLALEALLAACGGRKALETLAASELPPAVARTLPENTTEAGSVQPTQVAAAPEGGFARLAVARNAEPDVLVQRALASLGGMERFVPAGSDVIIKPNICVSYHSYEYAATTNPWVVAALVRLSLAAGARRVRVMDYPFGGEAAVAYSVSGIQEQVEAAGGSMEAMTRFKFIDTALPVAVALKRAAIYDDMLKADVLINVPVAKTHGLARLTLGMKNLMGTVLDRPALHRNLGQNLADLAGHLRPALTVIDAVRVLTANGPTGGNLDDVRKMDTIIASADIVAADAYGASLFGVNPADLDYVTAGAVAGLGSMDLSSLKIEEIDAGT